MKYLSRSMWNDWDRGGVPIGEGCRLHSRWYYYPWLGFWKFLKMSLGNVLANICVSSVSYRGYIILLSSLIHRHKWSNCVDMLQSVVPAKGWAKTELLKDFLSHRSRFLTCQLNLRSASYRCTLWSKRWSTFLMRNSNSDQGDCHASFQTFNTARQTICLGSKVCMETFIHISTPYITFFPKY